MSYVFEPDDYSMVVKSRAKPPAPWRWEIYRAGRNSPRIRKTFSHRRARRAARARRR